LEIQEKNTHENTKDQKIFDPKKYLEAKNAKK